MYPQYLAYESGGLAAIQQMTLDTHVEQRVEDYWPNLDEVRRGVSGQAVLDKAIVDMALHEQRYVLDPLIFAGEANDAIWDDIDNLGGGNSASPLTGYTHENGTLREVVPFDGPEEQRSIRKGILVGAKGNGTSTIYTNLDITQENQFVGGQIQFWNSRFPISDTVLAAPGVTIKSHTAGSNAVFELEYGVAPNETDYIWIADDDVSDATDFVTNPQPEVSPQLPDVTLFNHEDAFPAANIEAVFDGAAAAASSIAPFELNSVTQAPYTADDFIAASKALASMEGYWVATALGAYQGDVIESHDPDNDGWLLGTSVPYHLFSFNPASRGGVLLFAETIRNYADRRQVSNPLYTFETLHSRTTLHEVGHLLGGRHEDGGIMREGSLGVNPDGGMFAGKSLRRFMLLRDEGTS